ncbi:MAG: glycosyltransferase family A protein [Algibacter sp.]
MLSTKDIEILISTVEKTSLSFLEEMFPFSHYSNYNILIVNQTTESNVLTSDYKRVRVVNSFKKGLSISRNIALKNAKLDICLLADDDVIYDKEFEGNIKNAFKRYKEADIISFQMVNSMGNLYTKYPSIVKHDKKTVKTVNSVVIALKRSAIINNCVTFNTHFGLGSVFETADEYVFLRSALRNNLKIFFEPKIILKHPCFSSGTAVSSDKVIFARSAVFYKYNGVLTYLKLWHHLFLLFKSNDLKINKILKKYNVGLKGIKKYRSLLNIGLEKRNS